MTYAFFYFKKKCGLDNVFAAVIFTFWTPSSRIAPGSFCLADISSSVPETPDIRRPVTAKERQREREEKRKRRQERAKEREKQKKEKEREHKDMLTENDRNLLERWTKMVDRTQNKPIPNGSTAPPQRTPASHALPSVPAAKPLPPQAHPSACMTPTPSHSTPAPSEFLAFSDKAPPGLAPKLTLLPVGTELASVQASNANVIRFFPAQTAPFVVATPACPKAIPAKSECLLNIKYAPSEIFQGPYGVTALNAWRSVSPPENWAVSGQLPVGQPEVAPAGPLPEPVVNFVARAGADQPLFQSEMGKSELPPQALTTEEETRGSVQSQVASGLPSESPDINVVTQQLSKSQVKALEGLFLLISGGYMAWGSQPIDVCALPIIPKSWEPLASLEDAHGKLSAVSAGCSVVEFPERSVQAAAFLLWGS